MTEPIENFVTVEKTFRGTQRPVLTSQNSGPPLILLHEIFGMSVAVANFAQTLRQAGFRIYMPVLYGSTTPVDSWLAKRARGVQFLCVAHQFRVFSNDESGPWADWLRDLVDWACADTARDKAGVIGLCLTGNFALATAVNPRVRGAVMGEPSLPFHNDGLHLTPAELSSAKARLAQEQVEVRAYRYSTDTICRASLIAKFEAELGAGFTAVTLPVTEKGLHSVFTENLCDASGRPRHDKVQEVIGFFSRLLLP